MTDNVTLNNWYESNRNTADGIIRALKKLRLEGFLHAYCYTVKILHLQYVVSEDDYRFQFKSYFQKVDTGLLSIQMMLIYNGVLTLNKNVRMTLEYWLLCGNMYETIVSKITDLMETTKDKVDRNELADMRQLFVDTSIREGIKTSEEWKNFAKSTSEITIKTEEQNIPVVIPEELKSEDIVN
jgi:hypothetical protein